MLTRKAHFIIVHSKAAKACLRREMLLTGYLKLKPADPSGPIL